MLITVSGLSIFGFAGWLSGAPADGISAVVLTLQSEKQQFILGEPVALLFRITNQSSSRIEVPGAVDVLGGGVRVQIAFENGPYREYRGPMWGAVNRRGSQPLDSAKSIETAATVLHNRGPKRGDLNEERWKIVTEREIDSEIAFPKPGRYRLKAILFGKIESAPLEIRVGEPQTVDDIEVWKVISSQPEYVLFMQSGDLLKGTLTDRENKEFVDALEKFINYYATSTYTPHFRAAIAKYRASVERHLKTVK
jgi:hypothetical protein